MEYKTTAKLVIQSCDKDLPGVFGHGCVLLLQGIAREHSLNRAAKSMGMAYSKAWRIVNEAEGQLGCKLIERDGARGSTSPRRQASHRSLRNPAGRNQRHHRLQSQRPHRKYQRVANLRRTLSRVDATTKGLSVPAKRRIVLPCLPRGAERRVIAPPAGDVRNSPAKHRTNHLHYAR